MFSYIWAIKTKNMYKINQEQLQSIVNYLATKPYAEVFQLIQLISNLEKIEENDSN